VAWPKWLASQNEVHHKNGALNADTDPKQLPNYVSRPLGKQRNEALTGRIPFAPGWIRGDN
jgi:hypothetical protein